MRRKRMTYVATDVPATRTRVRWDRIAGGIAVGAVAGALIVGAWNAIPAAGADEAYTPPAGGIPLCSQHVPDCAREMRGEEPPASAVEAIERVTGETPDTMPATPEPVPAAEPAAVEVESGVSHGGTLSPGAVAPVESGSVAGDGQLTDGEVADGPVTEPDMATLICGTEYDVVIDTDMHGNAWAYCG